MAHPLVPIGVLALYNPNDTAQARGAGPRYLLGDVPHTAAKQEQPKRKA
jgi:hypothetical protein